MGNVRGKPVGKTRPATEMSRRDRVGMVVRRIARELQRYRDSLGLAVGVCNGYDPTEEPDKYRHRIKSITGKVKAIRKGGRALLLSLQELENLASE